MLLVKREAEIKKVLWVTLGLNLLVAFLKIATGYSFGLLGLSSSGYESLFDGSANILALVSIALASRPPDADHHFGHHKHETLGSLIISGLILFSAVKIGIDVYVRIHSSQEQIPPLGNSLIPLIMMSFSMMTSFFVSRYEGRKGRELSSSILLADAGHTMGDFVVSGFVIVSIVLYQLGIYWVDWGCASLVCLYMVYLGLKIAKTNIDELLDTSPVIDLELIAEIEKIENIQDIHRFRARGNSHWMQVDFHIHLDPDLSLIKAHQIGKLAEGRVRELLSAYANEIDILVHIEPAGPKETNGN